MCDHMQYAEVVNAVTSPEGKSHYAWRDEGKIKVFAVDPTAPKAKQFRHLIYTSSESYRNEWFAVPWFAEQSPAEPPELFVEERCFWGTRFSFSDVLEQMDDDGEAVRLWQTLSHQQKAVVFENLERCLEKGFEGGMMTDWTVVASAALSEEDLQEAIKNTLRGAA